MEELRARFLVLIERRKLLAAVAAREHRDWTEDELVELGKLNAALEAIRYTLNEILAADAPTKAPDGVDPAIAKKDDDDYRMQAKAFRDFHIENYHFSMEQVGQAGRWLLATVAATQFGGLLLVSQLAGKLDPTDLKPAMWSLVAGLVLILMSGLVTYYNWSAAAEVYGALTGPPAYLVEKARWPAPTDKAMRTMAMTALAAIALGVLSVLSLPVAAYFVAIAKAITMSQGAGG